MTYADRVKKLLTPPEIRLFRRLNTPQKIQDYLDTLPVNFGASGETYMSPRRVLRAKRCHCAEGALLAAAILAFHDEKPLLMDLQAASPDVDHVVALFRRRGLWGAISKTNYPVVRYRDPIYPDIRSLALSFFHEYFLDSGKKTLRTYSTPFDLTKYAPEKWITAQEELQELMDKLDASRHFPIVPKKNLREIKRASSFERKVTAAREWSKSGRKRR
jgi:hypothetical protein